MSTNQIYYQNIKKYNFITFRNILKNIVNFGMYMIKNIK